MKRILGLAALLGHTLSVATGIESFKVKRGGRGSNKRPVYGNAYFSGSRPTDARWWHDITDPAQGLRFDAAVSKRERRACKLHNIHARASSNPAHRTDYEFLPSGRLVATTIPASLSPTYVAK